MAHILKLRTIVEGVETAAQVAYLRKHSCDFIQGYNFGRPLPVAQFEQLLREKIPAQSQGRHLRTIPAGNSAA